MRLSVVTLLLLPLAAPAGQEAQPPTCTSLTDCRQMALDAAAREDYETFHTLAWRAVQTGPRNDPSLMYLLARAQSLSGRANDALVMLRRLAEMGTGAVAAETSDDFRRVRSLPGWTAVLERIRASAGHPPAAPTINSAVEARREPAARSEREPAARSETEEITVPATLTRPVALDYDAVSRRFVFADEGSETLKIVDELSGKAVNLVSRGWAGAYQTAALAIDPRRGDLWVAGADSESGTMRSAVHRLQLVSGRLLYTVALPAEAGGARFADIALVGGTALFLDQRGRRVYQLAPGSKTFRLHTKIDDNIEPASLAPAGDTVLYIAHGTGIMRVNVSNRTNAPLKAAGDVALQGLQWIREYKGALLGIQTQADGSHLAVRIRLDSRGRTATSIEVLGSAASKAAAIAGGVFYFLAKTSADTETVLRRLKLND